MGDVLLPGLAMFISIDGGSQFTLCYEDCEDVEGGMVPT